MTQLTRGNFEINPDFKPEQLTPDERVLYNWVWDYLGDLRDKMMEPMLQGQSPGNPGVSLPNGTMHIKNNRYFQWYVHTLGILIQRVGDPRALAELIRTASGLIDRTQTTYGPNVSSETDMRLEQPGIRRWIYWTTQEWPLGPKQAAFVDTDNHDLENDLLRGTWAEVEYILSRNFFHISISEFVKISDFVTNDIEERYRFLSEKQYGRDAPYWINGHSLRHSTESKYNFHYFRYLTHGKDEDKEAYEQLGKWLREDREFVKLKRGGSVLIVPHQVTGRAKQLGKRLPLVQGHQDSTYVQESVPHTLMARWADSPYHTWAEISAMAKTLHYCVMNEGPAAPTVAADIGGGGSTKYNQKKVIIARNGEVYPSKTVISRRDAREHAMTVYRGLALCTTFSTGNKGLMNELRVVDENSTLNRRGARVAMFLAGVDKR